MDTTPHRILVDAFERIRDSVPAVLDGATAEMLAWRPDADANSIAWLVWHLARVQDDHLVGVARALGDAEIEQAWLADGWARRFDLPLPDADIGYGNSSAEVATVRPGADLLAGYHAAVHDLTVAVVERMTTDDFDVIVDRRWDPPVTAAVRLVSVIDDAARHIGQAEYVRGLWDRRPA